MARFELQFDISEAPKYAARYPDQDDDAVLTIGRNARGRGYYTRDEFVAVCRWKTPRSGPLVATNSEREVETATRAGLSDHSSQRERIDALRSLAGVEFPTASVLLHLADPDRYPILDKRALHALGVRRATYSHRFWAEYVEQYRRLVQNTRLDGRTLDRALWQWSREHDIRP